MHCGAGIVPADLWFEQPANRRSFQRQDKQDAGASGTRRKRGKEI